jgi:hypothetical protein
MLYSMARPAGKRMASRRKRVKVRRAAPKARRKAPKRRGKKARLVKGSRAAKAYMAKIRRKRRK